MATESGRGEDGRRNLGKGGGWMMRDCAQIQIGERKSDGKFSRRGPEFPQGNGENEVTPPQREREMGVTFRNRDCVGGRGAREGLGEAVGNGEGDGKL